MERIFEVTEKITMKGLKEKDLMISVFSVFLVVNDFVFVKQKSLMISLTENLLKEYGHL